MADLFVQGVQEDGGLHCLSQAHLVGQDGVRGLRPGEPQPVQPLQLVGVQGAPRAVQVVWLPVKLDGGLERRRSRRLLNCSGQTNAYAALHEK